MGRTGVFITLSIVLERMRYEGVVDMFQTVKTLRTQRPAMVQTEVCRPVCRVEVSLTAFPATLGCGSSWTYMGTSVCLYYQCITMPVLMKVQERNE